VEEGWLKVSQNAGALKPQPAIDVCAVTATLNEDDETPSVI
jgi:hypothetical protein